ncbi:trehalose biosynthesis protein [Brachybacterium hainanense]|uniref:Trehalose biosynthesis protein n=1 Tax=Brachybacterium hainanense TaxID=1541174 RepID=A0ABV6RF46_9MICO
MDDVDRPVPGTPPGAGTASVTAALSPALTALLPALAAWMPQRRWFVREAGEEDGCPPRLELLAVLPLPLAPVDPGALPGTRVLLLLLRARPGGSEEPPAADALGGAVGGYRDYQVPLVLRPQAATGVGEPSAEQAPVPAVIGEVTVDGTPLRVIDAVEDGSGRRALLHLLTSPPAPRQKACPGGEAPALRLVADGVRGGRGLGPVRASRLLRGEQSNSSMIFEIDGADPVILKLFRILQGGANPDVEVQSVLDAAQCAAIAPLLGAVRAVPERGLRIGTADEADRGEDPPAVHLLLAQRFLPDVQDAWRVALERARTGTSFRTQAHELGAATGQVHRILAREMRSVPADARAREQMIAGMLERLEEAARDIPQIAAQADDLRLLIQRARSGPWPPLQRIHGDYHLGQVLRTASDGWVLLDFEGEPLRPLAQRTAPDCTLRDVAGMLRSLDYAAAAVRRSDGVDARAWAEDARAAFLAGYREVRLPEDPAGQASLLRVFEADKAIYEALYEARLRPDWLGIPLEALERILAQDRLSAEAAPGA